MQTAIMDTAEAVDISTAAQGIGVKTGTPAEQYPQGFKFNRLQRDGSLEEIMIERYLPWKKAFIVERTIGEFQVETEMPLERVEAMTAPELFKNPVGTNVIVPLKGKKLAGKMAGYLKESDEYVIWVRETGEKPRLLKVSRESFDAVNYREVRKKLMEVLR